MFKPLFNSVLVEIDDKEGSWGGSGDDSVLGKSYNRGKVVSMGLIIPTQQYLAIELIVDNVLESIGKDVMWNEGDEAGVTFEEDGKLYGFVYWWNIRGIRE